jgi:hypothetical protein
MVAGMNGKTLEAVGRLLFGSAWRHSFEDAFGVSNRSLRRMLNDAQPIPPGLAMDLEMSLRDHGNKLDELLAAIAVDELDDAG